jgi:hypothetical protein
VAAYDATSIKVAKKWSRHKDMGSNEFLVVGNLRVYLLPSNGPAISNSGGSMNVYPEIWVLYSASRQMLHIDSLVIVRNSKHILPLSCC